MPVIRFLREGRDVECFPGENLRDVALREGVEIYGLKGRLGNCGGCGQCITCFVDVFDDGDLSLSARTRVEDLKLRRRPQTWRLACQALVERSLVVLTRPQVAVQGLDRLLAGARAVSLPPGPLAWPEAADETGAPEAPPAGSATTDEGEPEAADQR
ncbi:MAG: ferredoxin [Cyanobacteriota bacterium]|nr:ferredoxin [Cyanobacteriota bacterium]